MRRTRIPLALLLAMILVMLTACAADKNAAQDEGMRIVASFYTMADFARKIAGEDASVRAMIPADAEPHDWEPTPQDIAALRDADVFIYSGMGFEHWVDAVLGALDLDKVVVVEASAGIEDQGDPHVWLSPKNAAIQMENIRAGLSAADPANAAVYQTNYDEWAAALAALDTEYRDGLSGISRHDVVVSHEAFGWLCGEYGLEQLGIEGLSPDSEPDPKRMAEIIDFVNEHGVKVIFYEEAVNPGVAQTIAAATGASVDVLNPLEYISDAGGDYFSVMRENLEALKSALD